MARVLANPYGELRGTIAGTTFSRSKAGQIARAYVKPTNAKTLASMNQRAVFRANSMAWKALAAGQPATWNLFATNFFNPLRSTNEGQYSGFQSFVSCRSTINTLNAALVTTTQITDVSGGNLGCTYAPFVLTSAAPEYSITSTLMDSNPPPRILTLESASLTSAGACTFRIRYIPNPAPGLGTVTWLDGGNVQYGFAVYISDVVSNVGNIARHLYKQLIGCTGKMTITTPNLGNSHYCDFTMAASSRISGFKSFPIVNSIVKLSVINYDVYGTVALVGSKYVTVT
jgi:hypothetical protein